MTTEMLITPTSQLPSIVEDYLERALPVGGPAPRGVRIVQKGEMIMKPDGRALPFDAVEELSVGEVGFSWRASVRIAPLLSIHVVDKYTNGRGSLDARLLGVPVARARGQETAEGQAMRYLAELPWVPYAPGANSELEWRQLEGDIVEVAAPVGSSSVAVGLRFDRNGDILAVFGDRPRREGKGFVARHWMGIYSDYADIGGIRIPTRAEAHWELPDGPFVYWRATVTELEALWS